MDIQLPKSMKCISIGFDLNIYENGSGREKEHKANPPPSYMKVLFKKAKEVDGNDKFWLYSKL